MDRQKRMFGDVSHKLVEPVRKKQIMEVNEIIVLLNVFYIWIRGDCTVSEANGRGLVGVGLIPERDRKFPLRQHVQIASGVHPLSPISCRISTGGPRVKLITHRHYCQDLKRVEHASTPSACHGLVRRNKENFTSVDVWTLQAWKVHARIKIVL